MFAKVGLAKYRRTFITALMYIYDSYLSYKLCSHYIVDHPKKDVLKYVC